MIKVLLVDDSPTVRAHIRGLLEDDSGIEVVGDAADGNQAVIACKELRPDVVTMDLVMPHGGVQAIRRIMADLPTPILVVSALADQANDPTVFESLAAGALMVVRLPAARTHPEFGARRQELVNAVRTVAGLALVRRAEPARSTNGRAPLTRMPLTLVGVGASTGGPAAVLELLRSLPEDFTPAIALVQHITPGFVSGFVQWLGTQNPLPVRLAEPGIRVPWRGVLVAPDGLHMTIRNGSVHLEATPADGGLRPSADTLLRSMAGWNPRACAGVLLSGMGQDGAAGLARLRELGGRTLVQSEDTCVVFGMPGAAIKMGAAELVLGPSAIGRTLVTLAAVA